MIPETIPSHLSSAELRTFLSKKSAIRMSLRHRHVLEQLQLHRPSSTARSELP